MKEILRIIGRAMLDIARVLPDDESRQDYERLKKEEEVRIRYESEKGIYALGKKENPLGTECTGCAVKPDPEVKLKPMETWKEDPPAQEAIEEIISRRSGDASCAGGTPPQSGLMNEWVETSPLYSAMPCSTVAPPVPPVQTAPPVQAATTNAPELDSEGIPWDKRIHSSGKTKYKQTVGDKKEGSWIHRKGVDPILLAQVKTELFQKYHTVEPVVDQFQKVPTETFNDSHRSAGAEALNQLAPTNPTTEGGFITASAPVTDQFQSVPPVQTSPPVAETTAPTNSPGYLNTPTNQTVPPAPPVQQELPLPTAPGELPAYGSITKWAPLMREAAGKGINHVAADGILAAAGLPTIAALQNTPSSIPAAALALGLTGPQS